MKNRLSPLSILVLLLGLTMACTPSRGRGGGGGDDDDSGPADDDDDAEDDDDVVQDDDDVVQDDDDAGDDDDVQDDDDGAGGFGGFWTEEYDFGAELEDQGYNDCELVLWLLGNSDSPPPCSNCDHVFSYDQGVEDHACSWFDGNLNSYEGQVGVGGGYFFLLLDGGWQPVGEGSGGSSSFQGSTGMQDSGEGYSFGLSVDLWW